MRAMTIAAGALGVLLLVLPAMAQSTQESQGPGPDAARKAEAAKLAADPALSAAANAAFLANNLKQPGVMKRPSGLQYKIIQNGFGRHPGPADTVQVYYTGKLINGKVFDGTSQGLPATFNVSRDGLVQGWVEALQMMREGDHWTIWVPAALGYGAGGTPDGSIPPNQTLIFDLRLLSTAAPPRPGDPACGADPDCAKLMQQQQGQQ
jgi:FKBP-type peptidyl-prolyl cis-trans isomerase